MTRDGMIAGLIAFLSAWAQAEMVSWTLPSDWERGVDYAETGGRLEPRKAAFGRPVSPIGSPSLPFVTAELPVPRDATLTACSVEAEWEAVETALRPAIVQAPRVIGERPVPTAEDPAHFGAEAFPSEAATATEQTFSGQAVFLVRATPYRWNGAKGTLEKARRLVVTCTYALPRGVRRAVRAAPPGRIDMVIVSPPAFTNLWPAYVAYRRETHPGLNVVVKNTAEIYADYEGADDALKIHKYLEDLYANNGLRYAILGAGSQKRAYDAEREIPTRHVYAYGGVGKASDLYYSCMEKKGGAEVWDFDGDGVYLGSRKPGGGYAGEDGWKTDWTPDIACFRFPLREEGTVVGRVSKVKRTYAAGEQMDGLIAKLRRVESADGSFAGDFKAGYSGHRLFGALGRGRRDEYLTGESQFYDGGLNPWRAAHDSPVDDWEFITRWQVRNYIARNRPLTGVYCGRDGSPAGIYGNDLEMNVHASHGQPQTAAPFEAFDFFTTTHIQKVLNFCHSCETGHLDTDSYGGYGNLCFAEASVLNPHGGALATMNSTRVSYAGGVEYHEDYVLLIQACMNEAFFSLGDGSAAEAFVRGHNRIVQRLGGALNPADPMGHCYVVMNMMGDPLVRMARPGPDASCAGVLAGPCVTNATLTADVAVAADVGVMSLAVRPAAPGSAVTVGGAKTLKAFSRLTVENGSLEWNAPGGVANGGVVFTGARGDLAFTGAATRYFGPRFENVGNIRVNGSGVTLDFDKTGSLRDILSLSFTGGANAIRSREGGIFRDDFTIPVTDATLALETFNVGGVADGRAAAPLFALTNATLRIDENPYWETENLSRGITMNGSTIEVNYANAGFGPAVDGAGFNLSVLAGENRISGAMHAVTVSGTLSIDVADGASLTVSVPLKQAARAGSLIKTGEGTLALRASNAFRSGIVVREGVLVAGAQSRQALAAGEVTVEPGATLVLESLPAASITRLAVKAGGRLVLPGAVTTASYLIVDPLKASLDFADGARVYNEHDLSTPLAGSTTSDGYFMNTDGFLTWGAAGGTWTSDASVRPWLTSQGEAAGYEDGRSVQFVDRAAEEVGVAVAGAVRPGYASFANHATRYVFTKADDAAAILLDSLYTVGETSFEPSVRAVSKTVVTAGKATFADLAAGSVMVAPEGALNVTGTLSPLSKVRKIVFRATRFQGVASPFGQRYDGYQVNGLELLDGGSRLALPVGTKVTATGTFNGQTETKTMTIRELDESGYVADFAGDDLRALVDASAETGWGCKGAGNALVLGTPSVAITLELGAPVSMFAAYRLAGGDTPARSPSAWTVSVTEDSSAGETQVDAQALGAPAEGWWTSGAVSLDAASDVALSVAAGGALYLNGTLRGTVSLSDGARLAVTNAQSLTVASGLTLEGGVELDVGEAAPMGWTPVLKGAHLSPKDVYRFRLSRTDAAAKVVDGDLYVATANVVPGPYARTVSGDANWNTADWTAAGASLAGAWDAVATLPTGDATLTVSGETTLAVDTAVTLGTLRIVAAPGGSPLLRVTGTHALTASVIDFSGYSGTVVWEPDLAGASVVCGAGDVTLLRGDGDALTVPAGGVARLAGVFTSYANAPEGRIDFLGADRSFSTADLPSAGTLSFEGATVAGEFDNAALAWLVEEGDALVLDAAGATAPSTGSVDIRGGSLTVNPGAAWRFGENGRTRLTMTGGAFVCNANGTDLAGDSGGLVIGTTVGSSYPVEIDVSGGVFAVPQSALNFYGAAAMRVSDAGRVRARGVVAGGDSLGAIHVGAGGVFEIGAMGLAPRAVALTLGGGTLAGYERGAAVNGTVALDGAGALAAAAGTTLRVNGAVTGQGTLVLGSEDLTGEVRLAALPEAETLSVAGGTWHLGALRPVGKTLGASAGALAVTLSHEEVDAAMTTPVRLIRAAALPAGGVRVLDRRGVEQAGATAEIADGYLAVRTAAPAEGSDAGGDSISINAIGGNANRPGRKIQSGAAGAFPVAPDGWNQLLSRSDDSSFNETVAGLVEVQADGLAAVSAAKVTLSGSCTYTANGTAGAGGDAELMFGYIDDGGSGATLSVSGVPYSTYDVYVYMGSDQTTAANSFGPVTVTSAGSSTVYPAAGTAWGAATATYGAVTLEEGRNYFRATGLTGETLTVRGSTKGSPPGTRCGIAGIQIVNTGVRYTGYAWTGGARGAWSASDVNWRSADGIDTAWPATAEGGVATISAPATLEVKGDVSAARISLEGGAQEPCNDGVAFVPKTDALLFSGLRLSDVSGLSANMAGGYVSHPGAATPYFYANDETTATVQMQKREDLYTKCVKLVLTQKGDDIYGRYEYVRYKEGDRLGEDFSSGATDQNSIVNGKPAYHLKDVSATVKRVTLTGAGRFTTRVTLAEGVFTAPRTMFAAGCELGPKARLVFTPQVVFAAPDGAVYDLTSAFVRDADGAWRLDAAKSATVVAGGVSETLAVVPEFASVPAHAVLADQPFAVTDDAVYVGLKSIPGLTYTLLRGVTPTAMETAVSAAQATATRLSLADAARPAERAFYAIRVSCAVSQDGDIPQASASD